MKTKIITYEDGLIEYKTYLNFAEDESLILFLVKLCEKGIIRTGGDIEKGWRIQKQHSMERLAMEVVLDTVINDTHKYIQFFIDDKDWHICSKNKLVV